jgi:hypothetical protein
MYSKAVIFSTPIGLYNTYKVISGGTVCENHRAETGIVKISH